MKRHFEQEFASVRDSLLAMGEQVEQCLGQAIKGLHERSTARFELVFGFEKRIHQMHDVLSEHCVKLLALQSPFASDLRFILGMLNLSGDLDRVGDLAVHIARNGYRYLMEPPAALPEDILTMAEEASTMVHEALVSFMKSDTTLARHVIERDYIVDSWKNELYEDQVEQMKADAKNVQRGVELILIARDLACIGDHATCIAKASIFVISGADVRHARCQTVAASHLPVQRQ